MKTTGATTRSQHKRFTPTRIFKGIAVALGVLVVLIYIGLPAGMGIYTVLPNRAPVGSIPEGFEDVTFVTEDGLQLQGWYSPPVNGAAIILLHGAGGSRENVRPYALMLVRQGYGVLALDARGHGKSEGKTNRLGWQGTKDVGAAVNFLKGREEVQMIGGLGISMGGEVLLGAASEYPIIQAIAADGASRRCTTELLALESERPLVRNFTARVWYATVQVLSGEQPPKPLLDSMAHSGTTHFLLISAGNNAIETSFNQLFAHTVGSQASLWIAPQADHTSAFSLYPEEYEQRVIGFFETKLLNGEEALNP